MVGAHQGDRRRRQQPRVAEHAAVQQHLAEPPVVGRGRQQRAAAGNPVRLDGRLAQHRRPLAELAVDLRLGGARRPDGRKTGVGQAEAAADALLDEVVERHAADRLDHAAEHVGREAVLPSAAGLVGERQGREFGDELGVAVRDAADAGRDIGLLERRAGQRRISQAGGVAQQIVHRHRLAARFGGESLGAGIVGIDRDLEAGELRQIFRHRIGQDQPAFLGQHHRRHRGERLGHRRDPKHRVGGHRRAGLAVAIADRLQAGDLAAARHQNDRARHDAGIDVAGERVAHALQPFGRQADVFRFTGAGHFKGHRVIPHFRTTMTTRSATPSAITRFHLASRKRRSCQSRNHRSVPESGQHRCWQLPRYVFAIDRSGRHR